MYTKSHIIFGSVVGLREETEKSDKCLNIEIK